METADKETLTRKKACCPFCGCKDIWATVQTIILCSRKQPVYTDGIDCIDNDNEGDEPISGNTLGEMISSQFGELKEANYYLIMFNCDGCGKKWGRDYGEYEWKEGESGLAVFISLRSFVGGYHAKTYFMCNALFLLTYLTVFYINAAAALIDGELLARFLTVLILLGIIPIIAFAPVKNLNKPLSDKQAKLSRIIGIAVFILLSIAGLALYYGNIKYGSFAIITLTSVSVLILIEIIKTRRWKK